MVLLVVVVVFAVVVVIVCVRRGVFQVPATCKVYFRDKSAQTIPLAVTLR